MKLVSRTMKLTLKVKKDGEFTPIYGISSVSAKKLFPEGVFTEAYCKVSCDEESFFNNSTVRLLDEDSVKNFAKTEFEKIEKEKTEKAKVRNEKEEK